GSSLITRRSLQSRVALSIRSSMKELGEAARDLPWLAPCATSLAALTRPDAAAIWAEIRFDPGAVALLCHCHDEHRFQAAVPISSAAHAAHPLEWALRLLERPRFRGSRSDAPGSGFVDWSKPFPASIYRVAVRQAKLAQGLALRTGCCEPEYAWAAGLLTPLGWLGIAATCDEHVPGQTTSFELRCDNLESWKIDHARLTRSLSRAWQLPLWLSAVVGNVGFHAAVAEKLGAHPGLHRVISLS